MGETTGDIDRDFELPTGYSEDILENVTIVSGLACPNSSRRIGLADPIVRIA
jgi:hypothetical protein